MGKNGLDQLTEGYLIKSEKKRIYMYSSVYSDTIC